MFDFQMSAQEKVDEDQGRYGPIEDYKQQEYSSSGGFDTGAYTDNQENNPYASG